MPFFSVVIPLYNKENYVAETLRSVFSQTFADFEVLVVDDCSTDNSAAVVKKFDDARLRCIAHETNKGLSASRNTGINNAGSEYIAFVDADDLWEPLLLEKLHMLIETYPQADMFSTNHIEQYPSGKRVPIKHNATIGNGQSGMIADYFSAALAQPILWYGSAAVRKSLFGKAGFFDETITLCEDIDFNIRANLVARMAFYNVPCAVYRVFSENQIMNASSLGKRIPNFDQYEQAAKQRPSVKKYLDVNRYILAVRFKLAGDMETYAKLTAGIDWKHLTPSQKLLLSLPVSAVRLLKKIKLLFVEKGIRFTTFSRPGS